MFHLILSTVITVLITCIHSTKQPNSQPSLVPQNIAFPHKQTHCTQLIQLIQSDCPQLLPMFEGIPSHHPFWCEIQLNAEKTLSPLQIIVLTQMKDTIVRAIDLFGGTQFVMDLLNVTNVQSAINDMAADMLGMESSIDCTPLWAIQILEMMDNLKMGTPLQSLILKSGLKHHKSWKDELFVINHASVYNKSFVEQLLKTSSINDGIKRILLHSNVFTNKQKLFLQINKNCFVLPTVCFMDNHGFLASIGENEWENISILIQASVKKLGKSEVREIFINRMEARQGKLIFHFHYALGILFTESGDLFTQQDLELDFNQTWSVITESVMDTELIEFEKRCMELEIDKDIIRVMSGLRLITDTKWKLCMIRAYITIEGNQALWQILKGSNSFDAVIDSICVASRVFHINVGVAARGRIPLVVIQSFPKLFFMHCFVDKVVEMESLFQTFPDLVKVFQTAIHRIGTDGIVSFFEDIITYKDGEISFDFHQGIFRFIHTHFRQYLETNTQLTWTLKDLIRDQISDKSRQSNQNNRSRHQTISEWNNNMAVLSIIEELKLDSETMQSYAGLAQLYTIPLTEAKVQLCYIREAVNIIGDSRVQQLFKQNMISYISEETGITDNVRELFTGLRSMSYPTDGFGLLPKFFFMDTIFFQNDGYDWKPISILLNDALHQTLNRQAIYDIFDKHLVINETYIMFDFDQSLHEITTHYDSYFQTMNLTQRIEMIACHIRMETSTVNNDDWIVSWLKKHRRNVFKPDLYYIYFIRESVNIIGKSHVEHILEQCSFKDAIAKIAAETGVDDNLGALLQGLDMTDGIVLIPMLFFMDTIFFQNDGYDWKPISILLNDALHRTLSRQRIDDIFDKHLWINETGHIQFDFDQSLHEITTHYDSYFQTMNLTQRIEMIACHISNPTRKVPQNVSLSKLWEIDTVAVKLLSQIFTNILNNPSVIWRSYGDLNFDKVRTKFEKCSSAFDLLYEVGFKQSMDGKRLQWVFSAENLNLLKQTNTALQQKIESTALQ